jgi:hypothetical protein
MLKLYRKFLAVVLAVVFITATGSFLPAADTVVSDKKEVVSPESESAALHLIPEGVMITNRRGKLIRHPQDQRWFLVLEGAEEKKISAGDKIAAGPQIVPDAGKEISKRAEGLFNYPIEVLPGKWLTTVTKVSGSESEGSIVFRVWGEITSYQNRNFILPTLVATESLFGSAVSPGETDSADGSSAAVQEVSKTGDSVAIEQLRQALLKVPRISVLELPGTMVSQQPKAAVSAAATDESQKINQQQKWKDGQSVIDRIGRLIPDSQEHRFIFAFESGGFTSAEAPLILQPCSLLSEMEKITQRATGPVKFRVSGRISSFQGNSYLLLRKVLKVSSSDNLGK